MCVESGITLKFCRGFNNMPVDVTLPCWSVVLSLQAHCCFSYVTTVYLELLHVSLINTDCSLPYFCSVWSFITVYFVNFLCYFSFKFYFYFLCSCCHGFMATNFYILSNTNSCSYYLFFIVYYHYFTVNLFILWFIHVYNVQIEILCLKNKLCSEQT